MTERIELDPSNGGYAYNDAYSVRWRELNDTLPPHIPTAEEIDETETFLLEKVTFEDEADANEADDLVIMDAEILEDAAALSAYAGLRHRHAKIGRILAAEGLLPPAVEDAEEDIEPYKEG